ncbi:HTH-type transcriptional repressor NsrR [Roseivivax sp. THAF40]|uniref:Rrf2 family transcriptional regulator n=1 Tax=unclassified Roseivivax TaxID=2639302 RepID=UPI001268D070|nr:MULTISPECIES: Rrf2 family transcriptional regulator [unclassified Roseivivax]QFS82085.1 HTH-type transcriptional repressor NsrR [Roseivivax sp. THAF197b]QFT45885.1 HTH-type transcriptional repressor NsrR [Roseivivax sp. THAF40]
MRITKRTNIATRVLMYCAVHNTSLVTKSQIARACNASEHHLGQIVNQLAQLGYLETRRGRHGGLRLARTPDHIALGPLFRAFEAKAPLAECFDPEANTCPLVDACRLRKALTKAAEAFYAALDDVTLDDLVANNASLSQVFGLDDPSSSLAPAEPLE